MTLTMGSAADAEILFNASGDLKYTSVESGSQNWKQGNFQLGMLKTGQCICILNFKIGRQRSFTLTNNIKGISKVSSNPGRFTIALKSGANISLNKGNAQEVQKLNAYLEDIKNVKQGKKAHHGTKSFDLPEQLKSPTTPRSKGYANTPLQSSQNSSLRRTPSSSNHHIGNTNSSSARKHALGSRPNGQAHVAARRSTAGFDIDNENELFETTNASPSSDDEVTALPPLFVDEQDDQLDKENRSMVVEPRGVLHQRQKEGGSIFMQSFEEKVELNEERKAKTPVVAMTNKNFYGSRGKDMVFASKLGGGAALSQRSSSNLVKRPGLLEPTSNHVKKLRHLDAYDGWRNKITVSKPTNISLHGFSNLGNTCYMNAILQSLFGLNSFTEDLLRYDVMQAVEKVSLYWAVTSLLEAKQKRWSLDQIGQKLRLVKTAISATATRFSGFMQHDAHEFLCQCMDQLKEDVDNVNKKRTSSDTENSQPALPCPITQNFEFKVLHTIRCKECGEEVTKTEEFYDLSVDMPRISAKSGLTASIQTALDQFFRVEEIEYTCSECDCKLASVFHKFTKLPRIMVLHLKRYTFDVEASVNAKLRQPIGIPKYLTLAWHCTQDTQVPQARTRSTNGSVSTTPTSVEFHPSNGNQQRVHDGNRSNIRKRLNYQYSPKSEAKSPFVFKHKRPRTDSDSDLEKDPFSNLEYDETQQAIAESKAEEEKRKREEDEMKKVLEDSRHDVGGVKEITNMTEEEQIEYALALSRRESVNLGSDANGNHTFNGDTPKKQSLWQNGGCENGLADLNGFDETDQANQQTEYAELGELEQRLPSEASRTGESPTDKKCNGASYHPRGHVNGNVQSGNCQWASRETSPSRDGASGHDEQVNGDSGFASPELNGQLDDAEVPVNKDCQLEAAKETSNDSAIELDNKENQTPPTIPPKKSKLDYSNIIDLCGNDGNEHSGGGEDSASNSLSYAELKAKEEEEIQRATELSLQDFKHLEETEEAQLRKAQEMSLEEFNKSVSEPMDWNQSPQGESRDDTPMYSEQQLEEINANIENGSMPHSYRLVSVVNHIGTSSSAGHYVSDVYDEKKDAWFSYDDSDVQKISETTVREERRKSGYIFFYAKKY